MMKMFPFLVGRLKTNQGNLAYQAVCEGFPFLVGRLKTIHVETFEKGKE